MINIIDKESVPFAVFITAIFILLLIAELLLSLVINSILLYNIIIATIFIIVVSLQSMLDFLPIFWAAIIELLLMLSIVIFTASISSLSLLIMTLLLISLGVAIILKAVFKGLLFLETGYKLNYWMEKHIDILCAFIKIIIKPLFKKYILQETH